MTADLLTPDFIHLEPACYFSILPASHFSLETPSISPVSEYHPFTPSDPCHPLLAFRPTHPLLMSSPTDASRLLSLQTQAAHRPVGEPLQSRASSTSPTSSNSSSASSMRSSMAPCCIRCRRECFSSMYQIGTNRYYCSHCAKMTGYSAG